LNDLNHQLLLIGDALEDRGNGVVDIQVTFINVLEFLDDEITTVAG